MRLAEIKDGIVVNVVIADPSNVPQWCADWPDAGDAGRGWSYDGENFFPPDPPEQIEE